MYQGVSPTVACYPWCKAYDMTRLGRSLCFYTKPNQQLAGLALWDLSKQGDTYGTYGILKIPHVMVCQEAKPRLCVFAYFLDKARAIVSIQGQ